MYNIFSSENKTIEAYQQNAINGVGKLLSSCETMKNALLYFTMGKGKTLTAVQIAVNAQLDNLIGSVLIVAPPSTHKQWDSYKELKKTDKELADKVSAIEVLVAGQYVKRDDFDRLAQAIFVKLDKIMDKLDTKVDK